MNAFFFAVGIVCAALGAVMLAWGGVGRLDRHTSSESDVPAMFFGLLILAWGAFLLVVTA